MRIALGGVVAALVLAGCGAHALGPPDLEPGRLMLTAFPDVLSAGGTVHATVTVAGPADYDGGCVQTVQLWVLNEARQRVWTEPSPEVTCMALIHKHVAEGETASFQIDWPTAPNLPAGRYSIHGLFLFTLPAGAAARVAENLPSADVTLQ